ncbi:sugar transferase [Sphingomonas sp. 22L2VL55-3]
MKRLFDFVVAAVAIAILLPVVAVIAFAIAIAIGRPILFSQLRPGLGGKPFRMVKFRTMRDARDADGRQLPDAERMTSLGAFLRGTSLDELPGLYNVLKGDMSLVGPRPLLMTYLDRYNSFEARRHEVRPGITGWAQVNGRNALSWPEKFAFDVWYVDHQSFLLDLRIMVMTLGKVIRRDGISATGEATMSEFLGSKPPNRDLTNGHS